MNALSRNCASILSLSLLSSFAGCTKDESSGNASGKPEEELTAKIQLGLGNGWHPGRWNQLRIELSNLGEDFAGTVVARARLFTGESDRVVYRSRLELPRGGRREVALPVRPRDWDFVDVRLESRKMSRGWRKHLPTMRGSLSNRTFVLGIGRRVPILARLAEELGETTGQECSSLTLDPRELPTHAAAYDSYQLVVLYGSSLSTARPEALEAFARWVEAGGTLVAFPGPEWHGTLPRRLRDLVGVEEVDADVRMPPELIDRLGPSAAEGIYRQLLPSSDAALYGDGLLLVNRPGAGLVCTFTFTPAAEVFPGSEKLPAIYPWLRTVFRRSHSFAGRAAEMLRRVEGPAAVTLLSMAGFEIPAAAGVFLALMAYLVMGFLIPAWFFKKLRRREWTFAVIALAACLSTYAIYRYGLLSAGPANEVDELTILRLHASGKAAEATSFLGCISSSFRRTELTLPGGGKADALRSTVVPLRGSSELAPDDGSSIPETTLEFDGETGMRLPPFTLYPNGPRAFRFDYTLADQQIVALSGSGESPSLTNLSRQSMKTAFVADGRFTLGPQLQPGEEALLEWPGSRASWKTVGEDSPTSYVYARRASRKMAEGIALSALGLQSEELAQFTERFQQRGYLYGVRISSESPGDGSPPDPRRPGRHVVAWNELPSFPGSVGGAARKGMTFVILEFPPLAED